MKIKNTRKCYIISDELDKNIKAHCLENNIESESEFVRYALTSFFDRSASAENLLFDAVKTLKVRIGELEKMNAVIFSYLQKMHQNLLAYHAEIDGEYKDAAFHSAKERNERFFKSFKNSLKDEPAFFEKLLHDYFTGEDDGTA
ncbi:MAG: hypothetical protein LBC77_02440 [Spirochaetaceae bacterium]|jgi:hypothetical protein|nr:hypothetical protein [Spirochaetaceae bacterium]